MNTLENSPSPRRPYRLWLAGIAAGSLIAVLLAPSTGWLARAQLKLQSPFRKADESSATVESPQNSLPMIKASEKADRDRILKQYPRDFDIHLAAYLMNAFEIRAANGNQPGPAPSREILKLKAEFPDAPGLYAAALRMDTQGWVRANSDARQQLTDEKYVPVPLTKYQKNLSRPENLAFYDQAAGEAERIEPDNAYFPFMRSVGLFASNHDKEALAAILRAAECRKWDEHIGDEVLGKWRLNELLTGNRYAIGRTAIAAAILFPHYAQLRNASYTATFAAMQLEENGNVDEGFRIRQALMRIGDMMRAEATSLIGNLVGSGIVQSAFSRPGGARPPAMTESTDLVQRENWMRSRFDSLAAYWQKNGHAADVALANARFESGVQCRQMAPKMIDASAFNEGTLGKLAIRWCAGILLTGNAAWLLLAGALSSIFLGRRTHAGTERMPPSGPYVLVVAGLASLYFGALAARQQWSAITGLGSIVGAFREHSAGAINVEQLPFSAIVALTPFTLPILLLVASVTVSVVKRIPIRDGVALGFRNVGIPLALLLIPIFAGLCVSTVREEERVSLGIEQSVHHEGRYLAGLTGRKWPGVQE